MSSGSNAKRSSGHLDKSASRITESATCCCLLTSLVNDKGRYHSLKSREREKEAPAADGLPSLPPCTREASASGIGEQVVGRLGEAGAALETIQILAQFVKAAAVEQVDMAGALELTLGQARLLQHKQVLGDGGGETDPEVRSSAVCSR